MLAGYCRSQPPKHVTAGIVVPVAARVAIIASRTASTVDGRMDNLSQHGPVVIECGIGLRRVVISAVPLALSVAATSALSR